MNIQALEQIHDHAYCVVRGSEAWSDEYKKYPAGFKLLVTHENRLQRALSKYFRGLPERAIKVVNWPEYRAQVIKAADVVVDINQGFQDAEQQNLFTVMYNDVVIMTAIGAEAGEYIYQVGASLSSVSPAIQQAARGLTEKLAEQLTATTFKAVSQSIETSLKMGETIQEAANRLQKNVGDFDKVRAMRIARTESVHAYSTGILEYGGKTGAVSKTWRTALYRVCPICQPLHGQTVPIDEPYQTELGPVDGPGAHVNCKCGQILNYAKSETLVGAGVDLDL